MFLIAAISKNFAIGKDNTLPWHLPEDLKRFKQITKNCTIIMGRMTFLSIGKPLTERINIVITSKAEWLSKQNQHNNLFYTKSIDDAIKLTNSDLCAKTNIGVIGGYNIYKAFLERNKIEKIYLTVLNKNVDGDIFFPREFLKDFKEISCEKHTNLQEGDFEFKELIRI